MRGAVGDGLTVDPAAGDGQVGVGRQDRAGEGGVVEVQGQGFVEVEDDVGFIGEGLEVAIAVDVPAPTGDVDVRAGDVDQDGGAGIDEEVAVDLIERVADEVEDNQVARAAEGDFIRRVVGVPGDVGVGFVVVIDRAGLGELGPCGAAGDASRMTLATPT